MTNDLTASDVLSFKHKDQHLWFIAITFLLPILDMLGYSTYC